MLPTVSTQNFQQTSASSPATNSVMSTSPRDTPKSRFHMHQRSVSLGGESSQKTSSGRSLSEESSQKAFPVDTTQNDLTQKLFVKALWDYFTKEKPSPYPHKNALPIDVPIYVQKINDSLRKMAKGFKKNTRARAKELTGIDLLAPGKEAEEKCLIYVCSLFIRWANEAVEDYKQYHTLYTDVLCTVLELKKGASITNFFDTKKLDLSPYMKTQETQESSVAITNPEAAHSKQCK